jgi:Protein of unknown function DUF262/Protein of unknown function (DUF1524)
MNTPSHLPIEAHEQNIGQIFSDAYAFEIPPYQRPYAWERDQAKELLDDLLDAMDNQDTSGGVYFLGSIVLIKLPGQPLSKVIDGQQRLTTLTILLSILRDLTNDDETRIERRTYVFQKASADKGIQERHRVLLRERDRPFFFKYVQQPGATNNLPDPAVYSGSQTRIADNARLMREELEKLSEDRRNELVAFIIQRCFLVVVAVPTAEAARRIFTVLNARGLDLTPTDILKADLLERAGPTNEPALADRWETVEQDLGREKMVEMFGHIRMIFERDKPRLALESGFPKFVAPFNGDADRFISDFIEPTADATLLLSDIPLVRKRFGEHAARAVSSLNRIDNKDWMPPALLCLWKERQGKMKDAASFIIDLERLVYFLFVTRAGVNDRIERFATVMDEIDPRPEKKEAATRGLSLSDAEQAEFFQALAGPLYLKTRVCKSVLQRLDEALSAGGATYDELVSIEHVLPQTVNENSEWATLFPDTQLRSAWTHRIANLVFLTHRINTRASNWDFERKKREYFSSKDGPVPFVITQGVLQTEQWTLEQLAARQTKLLNKLCEVWRITPPSVGLPEEQFEPTPEAGKQRVPGTWEFTDSELIEAKRDALMKALSVREGIQLSKKGATCWNTNKGVRAVCTVSKRYGKDRPPYWYGYSPQWRKFLSEGKNSLLVLGCMDRDVAYAVPYGEIEKVLQNLHETQGRHWHIVLDESEDGGLALFTKAGSKVSLSKFELELSPT